MRRVVVFQANPPLALDRYMSDRFTIRPALPEDADTIAQHRVQMFLDMNSMPRDAAEPLRAATAIWLPPALERGEYLGWLASPRNEPQRVVAGCGVQLRGVIPFPRRRFPGDTAIAAGRQAIVVNVYTDPDFRRRGVARQLMEAVLAWARSVRLESLVLHASADGRPLYDALGFVPTNEMRFSGDLAPDQDRPLHAPA